MPQNKITRSLRIHDNTSSIYAKHFYQTHSHVITKAKLADIINSSLL